MTNCEEDDRVARIKEDLACRKCVICKSELDHESRLETQIFTIYRNPGWHANVDCTNIIGDLCRRCAIDVSNEVNCIPAHLSVFRGG